MRWHVTRMVLTAGRVAWWASRVKVPPASVGDAAQSRRSRSIVRRQATPLQLVNKWINTLAAE